MGPQSAANSPQSSPQPEAATERRLVSRREYARMHNVNEKAVRKAIAAGKIRLVDGRIDPNVADADWARNRDAGQYSKMAAALPPDGTPPVQPFVPAAEPAGAAPQQPALELAPLTAARIRATEEATLIKEITRKKLEGGLLEAEEVERTWLETLQVLKDRLLLAPDNIGDALAAATDAAQCRSIVMREIMAALAAMSKRFEGMAA